LSATSEPPAAILPPETIPGLLPDSPASSVLRYSLLKTVDAMDSISGHTASEVLEQLSVAQFDLVYRALYHLNFGEPQDLAFAKDDIVQRALFRFVRTYSLQRYRSTGEAVIFPKPMMPILVTITRRCAVDTYRETGVRPQIERSFDIGDYDHVGQFGEPDFSDGVLQTADLDKLLTELAGREIALSPLEEAILTDIYNGDKPNGPRLAARFDVSDTKVRVTKHRLMARLKNGAVSGSPIAQYRPLGVAK